MNAVRIMHAFEAYQSSPKEYCKRYEERLAVCEELGLKVEEIKDFRIDDATHSVIVLRKVAPTPAQYPRRYAKIKQSPL